MTAPRKAGSGRTVKGRKKPMLAADVTYVDYKDVTLLRTFISDRGKIRSRRITGLTPQQQRMVTRAIKNAREMALLPYLNR
ncbi:30S ribosomal protein S18 [Nocardioides gansuensis]|uniref:Small ribosomal subunit protein bS18 n=2 Tax=Nocardioides gansuensis TaxID=2138300 RepID=A0A2T8FD47_9ACTN|nr:30S ribosomal protein S18 [Nocardioides gansuensis]